MLVRLAGRLFAVPILTACFLWLFPGLAQAEQPPSPLLIGEVAWAGSSKSTADEWLELWNLGDEPVDLAGYQLVGAGGTDGLIFDASHVIPPQSAFVVANYDAEKSAMAIDPNFISSAVSLSNDALKIELFDPDGNLVDTAGDGTAPPAGYSSSTKASMTRTPENAWRTSEESLRMDEGVADFGTPGICDGCGWSEADLTTTASSTEIVPEASVTSSEVLIEATSTTTLTASSATAPVMETVNTATTTQTAAVPEPVELATTTPDSEPVVQTTNASKPVSYPPFRLHRVFPAPPSGQKEWVEIELPNGTDLSDLEGYMIYDATSRALTLPPSDMTLLSQKGQIVRIELKSSKLNNGGDTVELRRPDESVVERMTYPSTRSGETWVKNSPKTAWVLDGEVESESAPEKTIMDLMPPAAIEIFVEETASNETNLQDPQIIPFPDSEQVAPDDTEIETTPETPPTIELTTTAPTGEVKTTPDKNIVYEVTYDMLTKLEPNIRIAISGTVATRAGIVNKNHYVLLSPDGHGLYVRGTSKQPTPPMGTTVRVIGTLTLNDDGLSLGVGSKDRWERLDAPIADPTPRLVDFLDPQLEDGWSLVEVQGTIRETKTTSALLDLGDALVNISIKSASGYRASRLSEGDVVRVRGLVDARGDEPAIVIRSAQEIEILSHATLAAPSDPPKGLPLWMPFGAAGMTVAVSEGYKRIKKLHEKSKTNALIAKAQTAD